MAQKASTSATSDKRSVWARAGGQRPLPCSRNALDTAGRSLRPPPQASAKTESNADGQNPPFSCSAPEGHQTRGSRDPCQLPKDTVAVLGTSLCRAQPCPSLPSLRRSRPRVACPRAVVPGRPCRNAPLTPPRGIAAPTRVRHLVCDTALHSTFTRDAF